MTPLRSRLAADPGFSAGQYDIKCAPGNKRPLGSAIANSPELMIGSLRVESLFMGCAALSRISSTSQEQLYWAAGIDESLAFCNVLSFVYADTRGFH